LAIFASASVYSASLLQAVDLLTNTELAHAIVTGPSVEIAEALAAPPLPPAALASTVAGRRVEPGRYWVRVQAANYIGTSVPSNEIVVEVR
jgi:hypothetical protein